MKRNGVRVATKDPNKKPVWEMSLDEQKDEKTIVFDYDELLEFAEGDIAPVFGPQFGVIDNYKRRVRLPAREYLLVSRVTKMNAEPNKFVSGATMTTEYDLPINGELSLGGDVPWAILVESGQCDLMLISYMGIDFQCKSERVYRLLDTTLIFYGVATEGETLVYDIKVNGFAKGGHGEVSMFFFEYNCYCNGKLLIEMRNGAAGFFSDEELAVGKGVVRTKAEIEFRKQKAAETASLKETAVKKMMLNPCWSKTTFSESDMQKLVNKKWGDVLGPSYELDYRLTTPKMLMIDRIPHLDPHGGIYGLGLIVGEKILHPQHWYFPCHFVKDEVMAGSLVSDGCSQLLKVYMMWLGLRNVFGAEFKFRPIDGQANKVRCRGQISPHRGKLVYVMEIKEIGYDEKGFPYAIADVDIIDVDFDKGQQLEWSSKEELETKLNQYGHGDLTKKIVVDFKGIALKMQGPKKGEIVPSSLKSLGRTSIIINPPPACLKTDSNPPTEVIWHPYFNLLKKSKTKVPNFTFTASNFPPRAVCFQPFLKKGKTIKDVENLTTVDLKDIFNEIDLNFTPGEYPLNFYNTCEFMCGLVSNCLGEEFSIFDISKTSRSPAFDLALVTRVIKWEDLVAKNIMGVDVDPSKGTMIAEFDCPEDAWFFNATASNKAAEFGEYAHVPYSIIMEIALQTSGILTSILKAPLTMKMKDILFRNLDATSEMFESIKNIDFRGKTIINKTVCTGYNLLGKMGIHKFKFEMFVKEKDDSSEMVNLKDYIKNYEAINITNNKTGCFYKGDTSFGWFVPEVFENQVGLDNGKKTSPKILSPEGSSLKNASQLFTEIDTAAGKAKLTGDFEIKKSLIRQTSQSEYLDELLLAPNYAHGKKTVNTKDWFFSCHFWNDPVMPGSLGVESMFQLVEFYAIHNNLFSQLPKADAYSFKHCAGKTSWKYRGQLTTRNTRMDSEVFITKVSVEKGFVEIEADGNLFVDSLRVYEVKSIRLQLVVGKPSIVVAPQTNSALSTSSSTKLYFTNSICSKPVSEAWTITNVNDLKTKLLDLEAPVAIKMRNGGSFTVLPVGLGDLGDKSFGEFYGVKMNLYSGAMAKGIASADIVIAMGKANLLGSFGAGGLPMHTVEKALVRIKEELGERPFAVNLIHSPFDPNLEEGNVELFKKYGVRVSEASAFMSLTPSIILYRARGLKLVGDDTIVIENKLIAKCSRTEVAGQFLQPAPLSFLDKLLAQGKITPEQHKLAQLVPVADDVTIEADSGGHTDNRQLCIVLPLVIQLRNKIFKESKAELLKLSGGKRYKVQAQAWDVSSEKLKTVEVPWPIRTRIGGGGGIGCPEAAVCAFSLGAAFLVTGTINQLCRESGTCDQVRQYLSEANYADITMAPAADMFEQGVQLQVLKKGTMFPSRAKKLFDLFVKYESFDEFPEAELANLEKRIFKKTVAEVWAETKDFYINRLHNPEKIDKVEVHGDLKLKMSLCMRWYLGLSSLWANTGVADRKQDYQIWCGPAIGAFNEFIKGSKLDPKVSGVFPRVVDANLEVFRGAAYLTRVNQLRNNLECFDVDQIAVDTELAVYTPQ